MDTKVQNLFGIDEGKSNRQKMYEEIYVNHGIDFDPIFQEAHQLTLNDETPENFRGRGFMAYHMNWNLLGLLKERFNGIIEFDEHGRLFYPLNSRTRIYFKKLNDKFAPDNVKTKHVEDLNCMSMLYGDDSITVLYAGYKVNENQGWHEFDGCHLVEMKNLKEPNWISDTAELSYKINRNRIHKPITTIQLPDELVITSKNTDTDLGKISDTK